MNEMNRFTKSSSPSLAPRNSSEYLTSYSCKDRTRPATKPKQTEEEEERKSTNFFSFVIASKKSETRRKVESKEREKEREEKKVI